MNIVPFILGSLFLAAVALAIYIIGSARRARVSRSVSGSHFGWALLFLTSGRMPPPPPETQIEAEANTEKDRGAADPLRKPFNTRGSGR
jgi:hypothetical protein